MEVLYISYDGMTDPLGQSQVIPYLAGLAKHGYHFTLLSFEKKAALKKYRAEISALLRQHNIDWVPLSYTKSPPVLSTVYDVWQMRQRAFALHRQKKFSIVHCRSYIAALAGLQMKRELGVKFIFDMRAFYADERVDGKLWNLDNPLYKAVYRFFKQKEKEFLAAADCVITLTEKAKNIIHGWQEIPGQPIPIEVVPCCCDLDLFATSSVDEKLLQQLRAQWQLSGEEFVLSYLGSTGTWYMLGEMLDFFKILQEKNPSAKFLFITHDAPEKIFEAAGKRGIAREALLIAPAARALVPTYLALANWAIFFIQPVFSKAGSSPTKQGELMGLGIPLVCNVGVGDVDAIVSDSHSGIVLGDFLPETYRDAVQQMLQSHFNKDTIRAGAFKYYSLEKGIEKYLAAYEKCNSVT